MTEEIKMNFTRENIIDWYNDALEKHGESTRYNNHAAKLQFKIGTEKDFDHDLMKEVSEIWFYVLCSHNDCEFSRTYTGEGEIE